MLGTIERVPRPRRRLAAAVAASVTLIAGFLLPARPADAAGVTTHGWMAVEAIDHVADPELQALLRAHAHQVRLGAMLPDAGYFGANTFGEEAHWQRFIDAYVALIRAKGCDDRAELVDPAGPCADFVAHVMGMAGHGMGDEVWDWLFEPYGADLEEYYLVPGNSLFSEGGAETQMDLVAIGVHGIPRPVIRPLPDLDLLLQAFADAGLAGVTKEQFELAALPELVWDVESLWATEHLAGVQASMPWMSANMRTAPGGVDFAAVAIAGYWSSIWQRLQGLEPATAVSITHPAPGQDDLPSTGWVRTYEPGSARGRGGAVTRITAVLTDSMPYRRPGGAPVSNQLPAGTMTITDGATGEAVPIMSGYPRIVPYTADPGEHLIDVQPAVDLRTCAWHRVDVGVATPLIDARGRPVAPYSWLFRTACALDQCADRSGLAAARCHLLRGQALDACGATPPPRVRRPLERAVEWADLALVESMELRRHRRLRNLLRATKRARNALQHAAAKGAVGASCATALTDVLDQARDEVLPMLD